MTQLTKPVRDVRAQAEQAVRQAAARAGGAIELVARAGYVAKGVVYTLVGGLALLAALGSGGRTTGSRGALRWLLDHPYGLAILAVIAIGLAAYAAWCFLRAVLDPDRKGRDARGVAKRAVVFGKGVVYAALVVAVIEMMRGTRASAGGDDAGVRDWTAWLMSFPLGIWLVWLIGVGLVVFGLRQLYCAWSTDADEPLDLRKMGVAAHRWATRFSRFGLAARGVVFAIIGVFLVIAARHENPAEARGVGGALHALQEHAYGGVLLAVVALGLVAYGCYQFVLARYRRIGPA
jgi:hypothetical protein